MTKLAAIFLLVLITILLLPAPTQAFSLVNCGRSPSEGRAPGEEPGTEPCDLQHLIGLIMRMINYLISVAGAVAIYEILSAGFDMVFALGNAEKIQHSKEKIAQAVVGFAIVILAFVFVNLIVNYILGDPNSPRKWWDPKCIYDITSPTVNDECPLENQK